jgi:cell division transport system permease protein
MSALAARGYALQRAFAMIGDQPASFLLSVMLSAAALALPLSLAALAGSARPLAAGLRPAPELSVFVSVSATARETESLRSRLAALGDVESARLVPRDVALADLAQRSGLGASLKELRTNPLPDVLVARLMPGVSAARIESAAAEIRNWPLVDAVRADTDWYRKVGAMTRVLKWLGILFGGLVAVLVTLILIGTIRLHAAIRDRETQVLRVVGATRNFIVRPYSYSAALTLALASVVAVVIVLAALASLQGPLADLARQYGHELSLTPDPRALAIFVVGATVFGLVVGHIGARLTLPGTR